MEAEETATDTIVAEFLEKYGNASRVSEREGERASERGGGGGGGGEEGERERGRGRGKGGGENGDLRLIFVLSLTSLSS